VALSHSAAARSAGNAANAVVCTSPSPVSTACHCPAVNRWASPAAVVEPRSGTAASTCPAASARRRSSPTRKSSPASCADATATRSCPPVWPRWRALIGPIAASNRSITPSRSASSVTAAIPDTGVNDQSGAPTRTRRRFSRNLPTG